MTTTVLTDGRVLHLPAPPFILDPTSAIVAPAEAELAAIVPLVRDDELLLFAKRLVDGSRKRRFDARWRLVNRSRLELARLCIGRRWRSRTRGDDAPLRSPAGGPPKYERKPMTMNNNGAVSVLTELIRDRQMPDGSPRPGYREQLEALTMAMRALGTAPEAAPPRALGEQRGSDDPDLLYGVPAIAASLKMTENQTRHLIARGRLPAFKIGTAALSARRRRMPSA